MIPNKFAILWDNELISITKMIKVSRTMDIKDITFWETKVLAQEFLDAYQNNGHLLNARIVEIQFRILDNYFKS